MLYGKTRKPRAAQAPKRPIQDEWVGLLQDCVLAVVKLEKAETIRLAPLAQAAGVDGKSDRGAFLKKRGQKAQDAEPEMADDAEEAAEDLSEEAASPDGRSTHKEQFNKWSDEQVAKRVAFYNENKNPLLIAFGSATTKSFCKWYDVRSGMKVTTPLDDLISKPLIDAADALQGLAAENPDDKKLNKLSARLNALVAVSVAVETPSVAEAPVAAEAAPAEKKRRGRPPKIKPESAPAL